MITIIPETTNGVFSAPGANFNSRILNNATGQSSVIKVDVNVKTIPESFLRGLADCENGRVIDMGRAMNETPPDTI